VFIDAKPAVRKQIIRELQILHECDSQYIISFHGAFLADPNICICMEFMDKGSLDGIYKKIGPIDIEVVGKVAIAVLEGLTYLYDVHRIIHRGKIFPHESAFRLPPALSHYTRHQALQYPLQLQRRN
jgi:mitogen-activated protein kinase kinase